MGADSSGELEKAFGRSRIRKFSDVPMLSSG